MNNKGVTSWLVWAIVFLIVAIVAGIFGFGLISGVFCDYDNREYSKTSLNFIKFFILK
ncbi:DUF1328 domain-containing protein [Candidatus Pacearchaeota archaeon]|nr:DUF1328 domain-containing protein [Candidatus Pacearchaeota archaeon]